MIIRDILHKNKSGAAIGLPSFCSSNMFVIDAALDYVLQKDVPIVIEATCNQINQFGGYTGILPKDFSKKVGRVLSKTFLVVVNERRFGEETTRRTRITGQNQPIMAQSHKSSYLWKKFWPHIKKLFGMPHEKKDKHTSNSRRVRK